jgi:sec-independent protein translocase protein TatB
VPGVQELLVIGVVALLVFGPDRLPELARRLGSFVRTLRGLTSSAAAELRAVGGVAELEREVRALRREVDRARGDVDRAARGLAEPIDRAAAAAQDASRTGAAPGTTSGAPTGAAEDAAPPTDPEAT